jgi:NRPS condensation-like uncharacterized protein
MHLQDARSPWNVQVEVGVDGRVDEARLHQAVLVCIRRHPMARARLAPWRRFDRSYAWWFAEEADICPVRLARCSDEAALEELRRRLHGERIELDTSPGFRVVLARCPTRDVVLLSVNHVVADGVGALRLMQSVGRAYRDVDDRLDPSPLHEARDLEAVLTPEEHGERGARRWEVVRRVREALDPPARLAGGGRGEPQGVGFVCRVVDLDDAPALADRAPQTSINDVLLAALHLATARWNGAAGARTGRIGVMMPVNLRPPERFWEVVGNFASMVSISTHPAERVDLRTATAAVAAQTRESRREVRARGLFDLLEVAAGTRVGIKRLVARLLPLGGERLIDTAVLSNLGRLAEPPSFDGDVPPEVWFSPPCDRACSIGIGVVTVGQSLMLSVRYRREVFDRPAAAAFTEQFVARLAVSS